MSCFATHFSITLDRKHKFEIGLKFLNSSGLKDCFLSSGLTLATLRYVRITIRTYTYTYSRNIIRVCFYTYTFAHIRVYLYAYYTHFLVNVDLSGTVI